MSDQTEVYSEINNPLDNVEDVLSDNNWVYKRKNNEELIVKLEGTACNYRMIFIWQEHMNALQLYCQYNIQINPKNIAIATTSIMEMNSNLWMGHFEIEKESLSPCFRQTNLLNSHQNKAEQPHIEDLIEVSLIQCERYQHVFELLSNEQDQELDMQILSFAMMETLGQS